MSTNFAKGIRSYGMPVIGSGADDYITTGNVYFVHSSTGNDGNSGKSPSAPLATISKAIEKASANQKDIIFVMPGHAETVTSTITVNKGGISIIGLGNGKNRPKLTANFSSAGYTVTISAASVKIKNLYFATPSATQIAYVKVNAAEAVIEGCLFEMGANARDCIEITASGDNAVISKNEFRVTANGPDSAIRFSGAADGTQILDNYFFGGSDTNAWDDAAVDGANSGGTDIVITNTRIQGNTFLYGVGVDINSAGTTGFIAYNIFGEGTLGSMLDPGACMCAENYEADAADETARKFPDTEAS